MKVQVQASARRAPGFWRAGRYWSTTPTLVEVLDQDADQGQAIGQRSLGMLRREPDLCVQVQAEPVPGRPWIDPDVAAQRAFRDLEEALEAEKVAHAATRAELADVRARLEDAEAPKRKSPRKV